MFLNLTPHTVDVLTDTGKISITSSGTIRLTQRTSRIGVDGGVPLTQTVYGEPITEMQGDSFTGLPVAMAGTFYIVSQMVKNCFSYRTDFVVPAEVVRENGIIVGCRSLGL